MLKRFSNTSYFFTFIRNYKILCMIFVVLGLSACSTQKPTPTTPAKVIPPALQAEYKNAVSLLKNDRKEEAYTAFAVLVKKQPGISNAYINLGLLQVDKKEYEKAKASFIKAIELNSSNYIAYNQLGIVTRKKGEFTEAETAYKKAIDINENYANAHLNLGILYDLYMHKLDMAIQHYKTYQSLQNKEDPKVAKWIVEVERRSKK